MQPTFPKSYLICQIQQSNSGLSTTKPENAGMKRKLNTTKMLESRLPTVSQAINMVRNDALDNKGRREVGKKKPKKAFKS